MDIEKVSKNCYTHKKLPAASKNPPSISGVRIVKNLMIKMLKLKFMRARSQYYYLRDYLRNRNTLLEIGSGDGYNLLWLESKGFTVTGIEPNKKESELTNRKLKRAKVYSGFVEEVNLLENFDVVILSHALEHLLRPDIFLNNIKNNLADGGILFGEVPNCQNKKVLEVSINDTPHIYHFSEKSLRKLFKRIKYEVIRMDAYFQTLGNKNLFEKYMFMLGWNILKLDSYGKSSFEKGDVIRFIIKPKKSSI